MGHIAYLTIKDGPFGAREAVGLGIISQVDSPTPHNLALVIQDSLGQYWWRYVSVARRNQAETWDIWRPMDMADFTPLAAFGFATAFLPADMGVIDGTNQHILRVLKLASHHPRTATYYDGKIRTWQGADLSHIVVFGDDLDLIDAAKSLVVQ